MQTPILIQLQSRFQMRNRSLLPPQARKRQTQGRMSREQLRIVIDRTLQISDSVLNLVHVQQSIPDKEIQVRRPGIPFEKLLERGQSRRVILGQIKRRCKLPLDLGVAGS